LVKHLLALHPDKYLFSVSSTTRAPRPGEVDGVHYHFTSFEDFQSDLNKGLFLEHQEVHGNFYGTHLSQVQRAPGKVVILDIDVKGAL
jgi:guanylate kinase